jgi:hypothetical protein
MGSRMSKFAGLAFVSASLALLQPLYAAAVSVDQCLKDFDSMLQSSARAESAHLADAKIREALIGKVTDRLNQAVQLRKDAVPYSWNYPKRIWRNFDNTDARSANTQASLESDIRSHLISKNRAYREKIWQREFIDGLKPTYYSLQEASRWKEGQSAESYPYLPRLFSELPAETRQQFKSPDGLAIHLRDSIQKYGCLTLDQSYLKFFLIESAQSMKSYGESGRVTSQYLKALRESLLKERGEAAEIKNVARIGP